MSETNTRMMIVLLFISILSLVANVYFAISFNSKPINIQITVPESQSAPVESPAVPVVTPEDFE